MSQLSDFGLRKVRVTPEECFAEHYASARERFVSTVARVATWQRCVLAPCANHNGTPLSVDLARWGHPTARRVMVLSSGLHGVEGFFGSAAQIAFLRHAQETGWQPPPDLAILLLHALNPFGFAFCRRADENNVDLNRNFLLPGQEYRGVPELYASLYRAFDPDIPPRRWETPFALQAWLLIRRHGLRVLHEALPVGQYEFPRGLFYGGAGPSWTQQLLAAELGDWLGPAEFVVHLDFHTGLGRWGRYALLLEQPPDHPTAQWFSRHFPPDLVKPLAQSALSYQPRGSIGKWLSHRFPERIYHYACAEFGTYGPVRVMGALVKELRAHFGGRREPQYAWATRALVEAFAPASPRWRRRVLDQAVRLSLQSAGAAAKTEPARA